MFNSVHEFSDTKLLSGLDKDLVPLNGRGIFSQTEETSIIQGIGRGAAPPAPFVKIHLVFCRNKSKSQENHETFNNHVELIDFNFYKEQSDYNVYKCKIIEDNDNKIPIPIAGNVFSWDEKQFTKPLDFLRQFGNIKMANTPYPYRINKLNSGLHKTNIPHSAVQAVYITKNHKKHHKINVTPILPEQVYIQIGKTNSPILFQIQCKKVDIINDYYVSNVFIYNKKLDDTNDKLKQKELDDAIKKNYIDCVLKADLSNIDLDDQKNKTLGLDDKTNYTDVVLKSDVNNVNLNAFDNTLPLSNLNLDAFDSWQENKNQLDTAIKKTWAYGALKAALASEETAPYDDKTIKSLMNKKKGGLQRQGGLILRDGVTFRPHVTFQQDVAVIINKDNIYDNTQ